MTGRGAGFCAGFGMPGYANSVPGRGFGMGLGRGRGFGGGRGWRHWFYASGLPGWLRLGGYATPDMYQKPDPAAEKQALKSQAAALQSELDLIKSRLGEIEAANQTE